jgi:hypothetical protein
MRQPTTWWDQEDSPDSDHCINRGSAVLQGLWELGNLIHVYNRLAVHFIVAYILFKRGRRRRALSTDGVGTDVNL